MIEEIIMFRTPDGKLHNSEEKAQRHICDNVCEKLESVLRASVYGHHFGASELYKFINVLAGDIESLNKVRDIFMNAGS